MRPFVPPCTYIRIALHIYTHSPTHIYAKPCTYIRIALIDYMHALFGRDRTILTHYLSGRHDFSTQSSNDISTHKLNATSVNFFSTRQLALLPLFAGKVRLSNWMIKCYPSGGYSFYFHLASTISWKVLWNFETSKFERFRLAVARARTCSLIWTYWVLRRSRKAERKDWVEAKWRLYEHLPPL